MALLVFSFSLAAKTFFLVFVLALLVTDELALSASLAMAAGTESTTTPRSEFALLFRRRLWLDSAGVSMLLSYGAGDALASAS